MLLPSDVTICRRILQERKIFGLTWQTWTASMQLKELSVFEDFFGNWFTIDKLTVRLCLQACVDPTTKDELHMVEVEGQDAEGQKIKAALVSLKPSTLPSVSTWNLYFCTVLFFLHSMLSTANWHWNLIQRHGLDRELWQDVHQDLKILTISFW